MVHRIDSILVPTDGSDTAELGAGWGIELADQTDADLHVLSVIESKEVPSSLDESTSGEWTEEEGLLEAAAEDAVDSVAERAPKGLSGEVTSAVERGTAFRAINEYVDAHDIDVVVMGTHGRTGVERLMGSVTNRTLRTSNVPVVAVPPDAPEIDVGEPAVEDVLLPTDASDASSVAVDWGLSLTKVYEARLHAIYSVDTSWIGGLEDAPGVHGALEADGREALDEIRRLAREADVSITGTIASGRASRVIRSYADANDVDLIVMGTHGRSGLERYLIGSVTEAVVRNADVPVCCVPISTN